MAPQVHSKQDDTAEDDDDGLIDLADAGEEILDDPDHIMNEGVEDEEDDRDEEIQLQNDSIAHFDHHKDSIFCIAQDPHDPGLIVTGSGDDTTCIFDLSRLPTPPLLPPSYESNPSPSGGRISLPCYGQLTGHTDSINALAYTLPGGSFFITAGMDGRLRVYRNFPGKYLFTDENQEVQEINFLSPCPHPSHHSIFALGASDGSVWVYKVEYPGLLQVVQVFYLHTASCSAGAWTPDGKLLATVSEDGSFYVYDVFGEAAAAGANGMGGGGVGQSQAIVALTTGDQRFAVEGGLYSVAIAPTGAFAVVGGADGMIRVVGLPRLGEAGPNQRVGGKSGAGGRGGGGGGGQQAGQILASLQVQSDGVESLSFSTPPLTLLAAGSVDGSIVLFDTAHRFAVRRHIRDAHEGYAVVKVEFMDEVGKGHLLTSCGMDGVVRRFDTRGGGTNAAGGQGLLAEWRGHRGGGEKGGVLGFVQKGGLIVTAGDDSVSLVFDENRHSFTRMND